MRVLISAVLLACVLLPGLCPEAGTAAPKLLGSGDPLPELVTEYELSAEDRGYLDAEPAKKFLFFKKKGFALQDIGAEVTVIEFFNCHCPSCAQQAPVLNRVYERILEQPDYAGKIKLLGIAAGNTAKEVLKYKRDKEVPFPLVPDPHFALYDAVGDPGGTPYTVIARRDGDDRLVVSAHKGVVQSEQVFLNDIKSALQKDAVAAVPEELIESTAEQHERMLIVDMTDEELQRRIRESMLAVYPDRVSAFSLSKIPAGTGRVMYRGTAVAGGKESTLFAALVSRQPVCDICHGVHFIVVFTPQGIIKNFVPIHLTKYGNIEWHEKDVEFMKKKILDRPLKKGYTFNPDIDAVSMATMTSALIFNSIYRLHDVLEEATRGSSQ